MCKKFDINMNKNEFMNKYKLMHINININK